MLPKNLFGDDHEICYDTIINHDVYSYLRVSLEVPRDQKEIAYLLLNGKEIGMIRVHRNGKKTLYYEWQRFEKDNTAAVTAFGTKRYLGEAAAAIITDFA